MQIATVHKCTMIITLLAALLQPLSSLAAPTDNLKKVGQGTMSWLLMDIYQATLFSADGKYQTGKYPQALSITYQRNISKKALLKATGQQWQHLAIAADLYQQWLQQLEQLWPDINKGDQLTFLVSENGLGTFYYNGNDLGQIDNRALSAAFLSIWLSANTSEPKLRKKLIGASQ